MLLNVAKCGHGNPVRLKAWHRDFSSPGVDYHMPKAYRDRGCRCAPWLTKIPTPMRWWLDPRLGYDWEKLKWRFFHRGASCSTLSLCEWQKRKSKNTSLKNTTNDNFVQCKALKGRSWAENCWSNLWPFASQAWDTWNTGKPTRIGSKKLTSLWKHMLHWRWISRKCLIGAKCWTYEKWEHIASQLNCSVLSTDDCFRI